MQEAKALSRNILLDRIDAIPVIRCGLYPTPVEEMPRLREKLGSGCPRLFIKRDDFNGTGFGGNKLRKLEYAIAREVGRRTRTIVTIGGEKSNHARVTAAVCARLGLRCVLILDRDGLESDYIPASRFVYEILGAEVRWVSTRRKREPAALAIVKELKNSGEQASYIPLGVSFPLGSLGYVRAYQESMVQFDLLGFRPDYMFHATSSGGTQAGLVAGNQILDDGATKIIGVSADDSTDEIVKRVVSIVNGIYRELEISDSESDAPDVTVLDDYVGNGYGIETSASKEAARLFAITEGIILDPVYTNKAAAALIDWIRQGRFKREESVLFWHTGGQLAYFCASTSTNDAAA